MRRRSRRRKKKKNKEAIIPIKNRLTLQQHYKSNDKKSNGDLEGCEQVFLALTCMLLWNCVNAARLDEDRSSVRAIFS